MREHPRWRASHEERDHIVDQLGYHLADGRLSLQEYDERVGRILESRTMGELAALVGDLPFVAESIDREARGRLSAVALRLHSYLWLLLSIFWVVVWHMSSLQVWFSPMLPLAAGALSLAVHWTVRRVLTVGRGGQ
jgi:hypothetical protein